MKRAKVKDILLNAQLGGILYVENYFNQSDLIIDPSSWSGKIKRLIEENKKISAMAEIELIINEFNINKHV